MSQTHNRDTILWYCLSRFADPSEEFGRSSGVTANKYYQQTEDRDRKW